MAETSLYKITSPSGRVYIGQTISPRKRFLFYRRTLAPSQKKLNASFNKYGFTNHRFKVITTVPSDQADYSEKYLISYYDSVNSGLNILEGGTIKMTQEMRDKQSKSMTGRKLTEDHKIKIGLSSIGNKYNLGRVMHQSIREKISRKLKGLKRPDTSKYKGRKIHVMKPVICYSENGSLIKEYECISDVKIDGYSSSYLGKIINSVGITYKGKIWRLKKP